MTRLGAQLVLTSSNSCQPFLPLACLTYCSHTDTWSALPSLAIRPRNQASHSTVALGGRLYSVLAQKEACEEDTRLVLHSGTPGIISQSAFERNGSVHKMASLLDSWVQE